MCEEHRKNMGAPKGTISKCKGVTSPLKGKTYEEIYGVEKAAELRSRKTK